MRGQSMICVLVHVVPKDNSINNIYYSSVTKNFVIFSTNKFLMYSFTRFNAKLSFYHAYYYYYYYIDYETYAKISNMQIQCNLGFNEHRYFIKPNELIHKINFFNKDNHFI
ncbi:hypothetical protein BpHYR1_033158 [Brachionus plicatilis]|uniref:Uncharacterized protein n=1 Tax=Brachionus plicatilis TaxID=10195 RepID=A0A3M7QLJ7_BRAPC|nr:hypothetical protein BpHYR1_033158 [Brachionus plicatilis]